MLPVEVVYLKGFQDGWNECRDNLIEKYNLDKEEVIAMERGDVDAKT